MTDRGSEVGKAFGLIIHDLRNPAATIGANVAYVREVLPPGDDDLGEALADVELALGDLMRGMEQVAWIGRWLSDQPAVLITDGDVRAALRDLPQPSEGTTLRIELPNEPLMARGGGAVRKLVEVMLANSVQHARGGNVVVAAARDGEEIVVTVTDTGAAVASELRDTCFTLEGQQAIKGRQDGRYGRVLGLFASKIFADTIDAKLEADGEDGAAVFRIRLAAK
jgi:two-component system sensor histidine kinase BaeS